MTPASRRWARALFFGAIAVEWVWIFSSTAKEQRPRLLGVIALVTTVVAISELLLRRTALDDDAKDLIGYLLFGALLGLLPVVVGP
jgi:hypothetical protein